MSQHNNNYTSTTWYKCEKVIAKKYKLELLPDSNKKCIQLSDG